MPNPMYLTTANQVRVVAEIPKNAMGKINKKGLLHLFDQ